MRTAMRTPKIRTRHLVTGAALLAATLFAGAAQAAPPEGREGPPRGGPCVELKCTEAQKQELKEIFKELRHDLRNEHELMKQAHQKLAAEFKKDRPNEKKMQQIYKEIDRIHGAIRDRRHDAIMEVHGVLTPAQREKAAEHLVRMGPPPPGKHGPRKGKNKQAR